jgi:hypothetical protein
MSFVRTMFGIGVGCSKSSLVSPGYGKWKAVAARVLTTWFALICGMRGLGQFGWT